MANYVIDCCPVDLMRFDFTRGLASEMTDRRENCDCSHKYCSIQECKPLYSISLCYKPWNWICWLISYLLYGTCSHTPTHSFVVLLSVWMNPHSWAMGDFDRLSFHINAWCILKHWTRVKTLLLNFKFNFVPHENYIYPFTKHGLWIADDRNTQCLFYITHRKSYQFISLQFAVRTNAAECNTSVMCSLQGFAFKAVSWQRVHIMWLSVHKPDSWVYSSLTDTLTVQYWVPIVLYIKTNM